MAFAVTPTLTYIGGTPYKEAICHGEHTGHQHAQKEILALSVEKLGGRVAYLHVSDNDGRTNIHRELGQGTVDWEGVFTALKKRAFEGYVGVDIGRVEGQLEDLDGAYRQSKAFLENLAERTGL